MTTPIHSRPTQFDLLSRRFLRKRTLVQWKLRHRCSSITLTNTPFLTEYFSTIFETGHLPYSWRKAYIVPIPKKGSPHEINNYRGIALSSVLPKLFDQIITSTTQPIADKLLPQTQHGFRKNLYNDKPVHAIFFDLSKAFDTINHITLARTLAQLALPFKLLRAFMMLTLNKTYIIRIDNTVTNHNITTDSAVPQGSHCGPLLFNLYVHALSRHIRHA